MTSIAAYEVRSREPRIEIEHLPELCLFGCHGVFLVLGSGCRYGLEERGRLFHRIVFRVRGPRRCDNEKYQCKVKRYVSHITNTSVNNFRSEERRVGKEC